MARQAMLATTATVANTMKNDMFVLATYGRALDVISERDFAAIEDMRSRLIRILHKTEQEINNPAILKTE